MPHPQDLVEAPSARPPQQQSPPPLPASAPESGPRREISVRQILAGALAAASAAVASSWLGLAGTVLGAVVVSVVASVGTALYNHSLERSSQVIRETLLILPARPERLRPIDTTVDAQSVTETLAFDASHAPSGAAPNERIAVRRAALGDISWRAVATGCVVTLALALGLLTGEEKLLGSSVASIVGSDGGGGTTVTRIIEHSRPASDPPAEVAPADAPTSDPTNAEPSAPTTADPTTADPSTADPSAPATDNPSTADPSAATTPNPSMSDPSAVITSGPSTMPNETAAPRPQP